jgi:hypothetical protein
MWGVWGCGVATREGTGPRGAEGERACALRAPSPQAEEEAAGCAKKEAKHQAAAAAAEAAAKQVRAAELWLQQPVAPPCLPPRA